MANKQKRPKFNVKLTVTEHEQMTRLAAYHRVDKAGLIRMMMKQEEERLRGAQT